jgi:hypothetical protein
MDIGRCCNNKYLNNFMNYCTIFIFSWDQGKIEGDQRIYNIDTQGKDNLKLEEFTFNASSIPNIFISILCNVFSTLAFSSCDMLLVSLANSKL